MSAELLHSAGPEGVTCGHHHLEFVLLKPVRHLEKGQEECYYFNPREMTPT